MRIRLSVVRCPLSVAGESNSGGCGHTTDHGLRTTDRFRSGFTLIEMLIVITILAILASLVVGIAMVAAQTGREAKARNVVERIHTLLIDHYESFKTRRVDLNPAVVTAINNLPLNSSFTSADRGRVTAAARLFGLREMMVLEMPDRWSDLVLDVPGNTPRAPAYLAERTALSDAFLRRYLSLWNRTNSRTNAPNNAAQIKENQSAECLYMIVMMACGDGEARTQFRESDFGDTDGDGAPEFLDAWGHPICFYRWAPGYESLLQINAYKFGPPSANPPPAWLTEAASDHDPFDVFRLQPNAYRLVPLVFSAGKDESLGLELNVDYVPWRTANTVPQPTGGKVYPFFNQPLDPFVTVASGPGAGTYIGADSISQVGESADNINNHLIGQRLE